MHIIEGNWLSTSRMHAIHSILIFMLTFNKTSCIFHRNTKDSKRGSMMLFVELHKWTDRRGGDWVLITPNNWSTTETRLQKLKNLRTKQRTGIFNHLSEKRFDYIEETIISLANIFRWDSIYDEINRYCNNCLLAKRIYNFTRIYHFGISNDLFNWYTLWTRSADIRSWANNHVMASIRLILNINFV